MTLRSSDLQSDSDLDSIRNSCGVFDCGTVYILSVVDCLYSFDCCTIYIVYIDLASWERQDLANQTVAFASECDYIKVIS